MVLRCGDRCDGILGCVKGHVYQCGGQCFCRIFARDVLTLLQETVRSRATTASASRASSATSSRAEGFASSVVPCRMSSDIMYLRSS